MTTRDNERWSGAVPSTSDGLKFNQELWDYFMTSDAVSGLKSSMGAQLDVLRGGGPVETGRNGNTGPDGARLGAIAKYRKTWLKLRQLPGKMQEELSRHYGGGHVSELAVAAAHRAFSEIV